MNPRISTPSVQQHQLRDKASSRGRDDSNNGGASGSSSGDSSMLNEDCNPFAAMISFLSYLFCLPKRRPKDNTTTGASTTTPTTAPASCLRCQHTGDAATTAKDFSDNSSFFQMENTLPTADHTHALAMPKNTIREIEYRVRSDIPLFVQRTEPIISTAESLETIRRACIIIHGHLEAFESTMGTNRPKCVREFDYKNFVHAYRYTGTYRAVMRRPGEFLTPKPVGEHPEHASVHDIFSFARDLWIGAGLKHTTTMMFLIYVERLVHKAQVPITTATYKSLIVGSMLLSAKMWDNGALQNTDFANSCPEFTVPGISRLEMLYATRVNWELHVRQDVYSKYRIALLRTAAKCETGEIHGESMKEMNKNLSQQGQALAPTLRRSQSF